MMRNICVFCGSSSGFDRRFEEAAARLADGGVLAFESSVDNPPAEQVGGLRFYRRYRYGKTFITVYEKDGEVEA